MNLWLCSVYFIFGSVFASVEDCTHSFSSGSGAIQSPNYPHDYENKLNCMWHFIPLENEAITLNVTSINLNPAGQKKDYVEFWSIGNSYTTLLDSSQKPLIIRSTKPVLVKFYSNGVGTSTGFKIPYAFEAIPSGKPNQMFDNMPHILDEHNCHKVEQNEAGIMEFKGVAKGTGNERTVTCVWIWKRKPTDMTWLNIQTTQLNSGSFYELWENLETKPRIIHLSSPPKLINVNGTFAIYLKSYGDSSINAIKVPYRPVLHKECSQLISRGSGIIEQQQPFLFYQESECMWYFKPQQQWKVKLIVHQMNINHKDDDFLKIWGINDGKIDLVGSNANIIERKIIETTQPIIVQFHSGTYFTQSRFRIEYQFPPRSYIPFSTACGQINRENHGHILLAEVAGITKSTDCLFLFPRNPEDKTTITFSTNKLYPTIENFRCWERLESEPKFHDIWHLARRSEPITFEGSFILQLTVSKEQLQRLVYMLFNLVPEGYRLA